jgi:hypothetical protein
MARTYRYSLSGGIIIEVIDNWGPLNEWKEVGESGKLLDTEGGLRSTVPPKVCTVRGQPVITLLGASWDSKEGDTGEATVHFGINTPSKQRWELTRKT